MARTNQAYPPEFRRQMVELVQSGRTPNELAREYEASAGSIRNWVAQSERDAGQRNDGMSTDELLELRRLQREKQAAANGARHPKTSGGLRSRGRATRSPTGIRVRECESGRVAGAHHVSGAGSLPQRLLRMGAWSSVGTSARGCAPDRADQGDLERQPRGVRTAADPRRAAGRRRADRREAGRAPDAPCRDRGAPAAGVRRRPPRASSALPAWRRIWSIGTSAPLAPIGCGWPTSPM